MTASHFMARQTKKLLFLVTEDWYFCSHRLPLAEQAHKAGYEVVVATRVSTHRDRIESRGIRVVPFELGRRFGNPMHEGLRLWRLWRLYRIERPQVVYHVGLKPVVYGSLVARLAGIAARVNALAGLGYVFSSTRWRARLVRPIVRVMFRVLLFSARSRVIVQNEEDRAVLMAIADRDSNSVCLIKGAGVDLDEFRASDEPPGEMVIVLAARMLWDKGVGEFVEAARRLHLRGTVARFVLVGEPDDGNPTALPREQLEAWQREGVVEWWRFRDDMPAVFRACHVVCLPSAYGEGVPKVLIEAAASARAIVTTNIPGCRDIVRHGMNGLCVPPRDPAALADALGELLHDPARRREMGRRGRLLVEHEHNMETVNAAALAVVASVCAQHDAPPKSEKRRTY
jgi:glycosyltransferase involved in cell wall biosynthesis